VSAAAEESGKSETLQTLNWKNCSEFQNISQTQTSGDRIPVGCEIFRTHPDRPWGPPSLLNRGYRVFPGVKLPGLGLDHPPPSSAKVKEKVKLLHLWAFVVCYRVKFSLPYYYFLLLLLLLLLRLLLLNLRSLKLWSLFLCLTINLLPAAHTLSTHVSPVRWFVTHGLL